MAGLKPGPPKEKRFCTRYDEFEEKYQGDIFKMLFFVGFLLQVARRIA
jgi:hypothetical protein